MSSYYEPGSVTLQRTDDEEYPWYWNAFIGEVRINGGVCTDYKDGHKRGMRAVDEFRRTEFLARFCWDTETRQWVEKSRVLPAVQ